MITVKCALALVDDNTLYINVKKVYFFGIKIYSKVINSYLPIDIANCYSENELPKMGFSKN